MQTWDEGNPHCSCLLDFLAMLGPDPAPRAWLSALLRQEKGFVGHQGFAVSSDSDLIDAGVEAGIILAQNESHTLLALDSSLSAQRSFTINAKPALRAARWNALNRFAGMRGREAVKNRRNKNILDEAIHLAALSRNLHAHGFSNAAFDLANRVLKIFQDFQRADLSEQLFSNLLENFDEHEIAARHVIAASNLGSTQARRKNYLQSCGTWEKALAWSEQLLGSGHYQTARAHAGLAESLASLDRFPEAEQHAWLAITIARSTYGENHIHLAILHLSLSVVFAHQNKIEESIEHAKRSLNLYEEHPNTEADGASVAAIMIAAMYLKQRDYPHARLHGEKALALARERFAEGHRGLEHYLGLLSNTCNLMQDFAASKPLFLELVALRLTWNPSNDSQVITARTLLARAHDKLGEFNEAKDLVQILITDMQSLPNPNPVMLASMHYKLGNHLVREGDISGALAEFRKMVDIRDAGKISDDINVANGCWNAAGIARAHRQRPEQEFFLTRAASAYKASLPATDPRIARTETALKAMRATLRVFSLIREAKARKSSDTAPPIQDNPDTEI